MVWVIVGTVLIGAIAIMCLLWWMEQDDKRLKQDWEDAGAALERHWADMQKAMKTKTRRNSVINLARSTLEDVPDQRIAGLSLELQRNPEDTVAMLVMADRLDEMEEYTLANDWRLMADRIQGEE